MPLLDNSLLLETWNQLHLKILKELHYGKVLNLIYCKEYLMVKGPYCVVLLNSCSWFRIDPLQPFSREQFSREAQQDSRSIRLIDVGHAVSGEMAGISDAHEHKF